MAATATATATAAAAGLRSPTTTPPNISNVVLGNLHIKPWYPSFYPEDMIGGRRAEWLYVCPACFKYTHEIIKFSAHCKVCRVKEKAPPGEVIYAKDGYAIHQLDGADCKLYAQNLSLFAKLFLETKSVFFDASTFLYYTLVLLHNNNPPTPQGQVIGFFSKEKMSWDNNNVACILVFPPWQRRGYGQILIAASYLLGRREGRFGGPERPLSAPGARGYAAFWAGEVARFLLLAAGKEAEAEVSVAEISEATYILPEDVVVALREMGEVVVVDGGRKAGAGAGAGGKVKGGGGGLVVDRTKLRAWAERNRISLEPVVDAEGFVEEKEEEEEDVAENGNEGEEE